MSAEADVDRARVSGARAAFLGSGYAGTVKEVKGGMEGGGFRREKQFYFFYLFILVFLYCYCAHCGAWGLKAGCACARACAGKRGR